MTGKDRALFAYQEVEDLEEELVKTIYIQREWEKEIMRFMPEDSAPKYLLEKFTATKLYAQEIELKIRKLRYDF